MLDVVKTFWPLIAAAVSLLSLVIQTLLVKTYAKREDVILLQNRMTSAEQKISGLPSEGDLHKLQLEISELRGELREVRPELAQLRRLSDLLLENELKEKS
ncbi:conserved hypothetical protein [Tolumonas auensis DSM 9187]|uniref:DUF2730 domain-containing protein n=1 Tax=Tolumonas auensis (strain DSM 9187 / NBRC 110442 / TA 4) TaxID=595494 RepID=C4LBC8_TOLAT|nr:DUF2730 domain-containing protein [Tolumonas auensis]ACQ92363.1 conserved hypothetical protein [Tolumonas auensis DSM 9187]